MMLSILLIYSKYSRGSVTCIVEWWRWNMWTKRRCLTRKVGTFEKNDDNTFFSTYSRPFRPVDASSIPRQASLYAANLSSPLTPMILKDRLWFGHSAVVLRAYTFPSGFHVMTSYTSRTSTLHARPAQLILRLFKIPIMSGTLNVFFNFASVNIILGVLFRGQIFIVILFSRMLLIIFHRFLPDLHTARYIRLWHCIVVSFPF